MLVLDLKHVLMQNVTLPFSVYSTIPRIYSCRDEWSPLCHAYILHSVESQSPR